jgi:hypothetical protein
MAGSQSTVVSLIFIVWGLITVVLVALLGYLATLSGEGRKAFGEAAAQDQHQHELMLIARKSRLTGGIIVLSVLSGALLLTCVGFSI